GQGERLHHRRVALLERIRSGVFYLAEHVNRFGAWNEDRVVVAEQNVLRQLAVLQLFEFDMDDLLALVGGARFIRRAADDYRLTGRRRRRRSRTRQRFDDVHVAGQDIRARRTNFAKDVDFLTLVRVDGDGDLRVLEEPLVHELLLETRLDLPERGPAGEKPTDHRKRESAVRLDRKPAGQIVLIVRRDEQDILWPHHVIRWIADRLRRRVLRDQRSGEHDDRDGGGEEF